MSPIKVNHPGKYFIFLILFCFINCKNEPKKNKITIDESNVEFEKINEKEIEFFRKKIESSIKIDDTIAIIKSVRFPYNSSGQKIKDTMYFINMDYGVLYNYFSKDFMPKKDLPHLKTKSYFEKDSTKFIIRHDFPKLEFNIFFTIEKKDSKLKFSEIMLAG